MIDIEDEEAFKTPLLDVDNYKFNAKADTEDRIKEKVTKNENSDEDKNEIFKILEDDKATTDSENRIQEKVTRNVEIDGGKDETTKIPDDDATTDSENKTNEKTEALKNPLLDIQNYKPNEKIDTEDRIEQKVSKNNKIDKEKNESTKIPDEDDNATTDFRNKTDERTDKNKLENKDQDSQPSIQHIKVISNTIIKQANQDMRKKKCPVLYLQSNGENIIIKKMKTKRGNQKQPKRRDRKGR